MKRSDKVIKSSSGKIRTILKIFILSAALLIAIFIYAGYRVLFADNTTSNSGYLYLKESTNFDIVADSLSSKSYVKSINNLKIAARLEKSGPAVKPGRYRIKPGMNNRELIRMFKLGLQTPLNLTISGNIRTMERLAAIISSKISSDSSEVLNVLTNSKLIDSLGFNKFTFPGMFIQNTYEIYWTTKPEEIVLRLKKEYDKFWNDSRKERAQQIGLTPIEVITLASIVAMEGNIKDEHPVIAGVYINRIKNGIPLQADPTIKFALNDPALKRILYKHLEVESPYNTYKNRGLPPGPIVIPAPSVIDSVLNYKKHKYLYFCARPTLDGSHSFAETQSEHNRNARAYHNAIRGLK